MDSGLLDYVEKRVEPIHEFIERQKILVDPLSMEGMRSCILAKVKDDLLSEGIHPADVFASLVYSSIREDALEDAYIFLFDECQTELAAKCTGFGDITLAETLAYTTLIKSSEMGGIPSPFPKAMLFDFCFKRGGADVFHLTENDPPDQSIVMHRNHPIQYGFWGMAIFTGLSAVVETIVDAGLDINTRVRMVGAWLESAPGERFMDPMSFALTFCPYHSSDMALVANGIKIESPSIEMGSPKRHATMHIIAYERAAQRTRSDNTTELPHKEMFKRLNGVTSLSFRKMLEHGYICGIEEFLFVLELQSVPHLKEMIRHWGNEILIDWVMVSIQYERAYERLTRSTNDVKSRKTFVGKWFFDNCEPLHQAQIDKKREEQKQHRKEALEKKKAAQEAERVETKRRQEAALQEQRTRLEERRRQIQAEERRQAEEQVRQQALEREQIAKQEEEKRMTEQKRAEFLERLERIKKMNADKEQQRQEHIEKQAKEAEEAERRALAVQRKQQEKLAEIERTKDLKLKAANAKAKKAEKAQAVKITVVSPPRVFSAPTKALLSNMASSNKQPSIPEEQEDDDTRSTFSIATTAIPLPHPTRHFGERVEDRADKLSAIPNLAHSIKHTLKHAPVEPGNQEGTVVHRGRDIDLVTDESGKVAVTIWPAARPPSPVGSHKSTCSIGSSSSSIKSSASSHFGSALASSTCLKCDSKSRDCLACVACFHVSLCADCATDDQSCMVCDKTLGYRRFFLA